MKLSDVAAETIYILGMIIVPQLNDYCSARKTARNAYKILVCAHLLVLGYFCKCMHARYLVEEAFEKSSLLTG